MQSGVPAGYTAPAVSTLKRELVVTVGGREIEITVEPPANPHAPDARWRVVIDGRELSVDGRPVRPGTWSLIIDGKQHLIDLDPKAKIEDARQRRLSRAVGHVAATTGEELRAPIAGKVVKLLVAVG